MKKSIHAGSAGLADLAGAGRCVEDLIGLTELSWLIKCLKKRCSLASEQDFCPNPKIGFDTLEIASVYPGLFLVVVSLPLEPLPSSTRALLARMFVREGRECVCVYIYVVHRKSSYVARDQSLSLSLFPAASGAPRSVHRPAC